MLRSALISLLLVTALATGAWANVAVEDCPDDKNIRPDLMQKAVEMATNARDKMVVDHAEATTRAQKALRPLRECLEKYKNIRLGGILGVPNLADILYGAIESLGRQLCSQVDDIYNDTRRATEQKISLPGSVGGAKVGLPGTGDLANPRNTTVSTPGVGVDVKEIKRPQGVLRDAENAARGTIGGIFR